MTNLKRPKQDMPDFVDRVLRDNGLQQAYNNRPPYQRNDYLWWINDAKRDETKERRLKKMLGELRLGRGYMGMKWTGRQ
jgi:uncharacterized protein YdeI (YjbR/CyaY-like superfamily)